MHSTNFFGMKKGKKIWYKKTNNFFFFFFFSIIPFLHKMDSKNSPKSGFLRDFFIS